MRTQVGIVGAGPAGLLLAHLLKLHGIDSIIVEGLGRAVCEGRRRAGMLEHWVARLLIDTGVGDRLKREAEFHDGIFISHEGVARRIDFQALIGQQVVAYDQKDVVTDLIAHLLAGGTQILFEVEDAVLHDIHSDAPKIRFRQGDDIRQIDCDFIAGCDGFNGISRACIPARERSEHEMILPYAWLGILAEAPAPEREFIYGWHERGFALFSRRGDNLSRHFMQCVHSESQDSWPDSLIWDELTLRLGGARELSRGRILQKSYTPMRAFVAEPMQSGRLFIAGDAAHIVPPTGAKGMNLAIADACVLADALADHFIRHDEVKLHNYTDTCLRRVWWAQHFSWWLTNLLHADVQRHTFNLRRQSAEIDHLLNSQAAMTMLAENFCGRPYDPF